MSSMIRSLFLTKFPAPVILPALLLIIGYLTGGGVGVVRAALTIQNNVPVTTVSAASYAGETVPLATGSIAAAFGTQLAIGTQAAASQPLPTSLLNTTVTVGGEPASLFFVSSAQVNYMIPLTLSPGDAEVVVTSTLGNGDRIISRGMITVAATSPSIFTADASGSGAPAAITGRIAPDSQFVFDAAPPFKADPVNPTAIVPAPIDVGSAERPAYLVLFGTGMRNAAPGSVKVLIGGLNAPVTYHGPAPGFTGLDQVNLEIPVALKGRGQVAVSVIVNGLASNTVTVELAGNPSKLMTISGFGVTAPVLAGQTVTIQGSGFSTVAEENLVRFGPAEGRVVAATASRLTVIVPFGAVSGQVVVQNPDGEARSSQVFMVRTSISGVVQTTGTLTRSPAPMADVTVRLAGTNQSVRTTTQGTFLFPDVSSGVALIEVDGGTAGFAPPYPSITLKLPIRADRDNQFVQPISLQQIVGASANIGGAMAGDPSQPNGFPTLLPGAVGKGRLPGNLLSSISTPGQVIQGDLTTPGSTVLSSRGVSIEVPPATTLKTPAGRTSGSVQLTVVEKTRLPGIPLPAGVYSSTIAQITPLGTRFSQGFNIRFPNPDPSKLGPGATVYLYRYDSAAGRFVRRGSATVSPTRESVVSDGRVIDQASLWFVSAPFESTNVVGRVVDSLKRPVAGAQVSVRGRVVLSDQNGGFSLPDVAVIDGDFVRAEVLLARQYGTLPRGESPLTTVNIGGVTNVGTIELGDAGPPGLVIAPFALTLRDGAGPTLVQVTLTRPAPTGGLPITISSDNTLVARAAGSVTIAEGLNSVSFLVSPVSPGTARITARAVFAGTAIEGRAVVSVPQAGPTLTGISPISSPPGAIVTLSGTGFSPIPDDNFISFVRQNQTVATIDRTEIEALRDAAGRVSLRFRVPAIAPGLASIRLAVVSEKTGVLSELSAPLSFTVLQSSTTAPRLASVTPNRGQPGDRITLNGNGFSPQLTANRVRFVQDGLSYYVEAVEAASTSLVIVVPSLGIRKGAVTIVAQVVEPSGALSDDSNSLDFTISADSTAPSRPLFTALTTRNTGLPAGREGDLLVATGSGFGLNFYDPNREAFANGDPVITIFRYYQNQRLVNFALPVGASGGTIVLSEVPSGLSRGVALVTATNYDVASGLASAESTPVQLTITEGTPLRLVEVEPNDTIDRAMDVVIPSIIEGDATEGEPGEIIWRLQDGTSVVIPDLYRFTLATRSTVSINLAFVPGTDLDLFVFRKNESGQYDLVALTAKRAGETESLSGTLLPGEYLVGVGVWRGAVPYTLTLSNVIAQ